MEFVKAGRKNAKVAIVDNKWPIAVFFIAFATASVLRSFGNDYLSSLGTNLLSEFIGAGFTVYGIDYLIKRRDAKRALPLLGSAYEDVRIMTHWMVDIWRKAYEVSVNDSLPKSFQEVLTEESIGKIAESLDIRAVAPVLPGIPWGTYLSQTLKRIHAHAERVLVRHGHALPPEVHSSIYTIVYYGNTMTNALEITAKIDAQHGIPRPTNLGARMPLVPELFAATTTLFEWVSETHPMLAKAGISHVHAPPVFFILAEHRDLPAAFAEGELAKQLAAMEEWQVTRRSAPQ